MDIPHQRLDYFKATVEAGSVRQAARRLGIAASAVSRQISLLEAALGCALVDRDVAGVRPTRDGELLLRYCEHRDALDAGLLETLAARRRQRLGSIALAVGEGFVADLVATPLRVFATRHPGVRLDVHLSHSAGIADSVLDGRAHLGILFHGRDHPDLHCWHAANRPLCCIVSRTHAWAHRPAAVSLAALASTPLAMLETGHGVRDLVDTAFRSHGLEPRIVLDTNSMAMLASFVRTGMGVTLLPAFAVASELDRGELIALPVAEPRFRRAQARVIVRVARHQPDAALWLQRHLGQWLDSLPGATPACDPSSLP